MEREEKKGRGKGDVISQKPGSACASEAGPGEKLRKFSITS